MIFTLSWCGVPKVVQGALCHGSRAEKLMYHESRIFKFHF